VLTFRCAEAGLKLRLSAWFGAIAILSTMTAAAARADELVVLGCTGAQGSFNCVARWGRAGDPYIRHVPEPDSDTEKTRAAERDRRWTERCHPVIKQDAWGVARYHYSAPGCGFGVIE